MKFKLFFSVFFSLFLCISLAISSSAATYAPYGGITDTSSQANILYDYYRNLDTFSYEDEFLIMRTGQYSYYLFYGDLSSRTVNYISYTADNSYNSQYVLSAGVDSSFSYNLNQFTVVGNIPGTGAYAEHYESYHSFIIQVSAFMFLIFFIFYIFRSRFKELN